MSAEIKSRKPNPKLSDCRLISARLVPSTATPRKPITIFEMWGSLRSAIEVVGEKLRAAMGLERKPVRF